MLHARHRIPKRRAAAQSRMVEAAASRR